MERTAQEPIGLHWGQLREGSEQARARLVGELGGLWQELAGMVRVRIEHGSSSAMADTPARSLTGWHGLADGPDELLLAPALAAIKRMQSGSRALEAISQYERELKALTETLPESWPGGRTEAAAVLGARAPWWIAFDGRGSRPLMVRAAVRRHFAREMQANLGWQGL